MEEVLESFADNIAAMVIAASQENAEFTNVVAGAQSMKRAVTAMAEGARKTAASPAVQPDAKAVIEQTATELEDIGAALLVHAMAAKNAPSMEAKVAEQREVVKVAKDILQKVVLVVMLEDQLNIQLLTDSAKIVNDVTDRVNHLTAPDQFALILPEASAVHQDFIKRAMRRIQLCKEGSEPRLDLERAVEQVRAAAPKHLLAAQKKFMNPSPSADEELLKAGHEVDNAVDLVLEIVRDIFERNAQFIGAAFAFRAPTTGREDKMRMHAVMMDESASALIPTILAHGDINAALRDFLGNSNDLLTAARAMALECDDPVRCAIIQQASEELPELLKRIAELAKYCAEHPEDKAALAELQALIERARQLGEVLYAATRSGGGEEALAANANAIEMSAAAMQKAILDGDEKLAEAEYANLDSHFARHQAMLEAMLENEKDPVKRDAIRVAIDEIKRVRPILAAAMRKYMRDPKSIKNQKDFTDALDQMKRACEFMTPPHLAVAACNNVFNREIEELVNVCDAKRPGFQAEAIAHAKAAAAQVQAMKRHVEECKALCVSQERRNEIEAAMQQTQLLTGRLLQATKAFIVNPDSAESQAQLHVAANQAKASGDELVRHVQPTAEESEAFRKKMKEMIGIIAPNYASPEQDAMAMSVARVQEELEPMTAVPAHLAVEGPRNERIYAAAVHVEKNVPAMEDDDDTPRGKILKYTHEIAGLMAKLSSLAEIGDKKGMIETSRLIASKIKDITKQAHIIGRSCTDPVLRADVMNFAQSAENHAVQLKIMSAVKAASDDGDDTVEEQLVTAATGLAAAVVSTANACQAASIHKSVRSSGINDAKR